MSTAPRSTSRADSEPEARLSLRLRRWFACLGGALVTALGVWWIVGTQFGPTVADPAVAVVSLLGSVAAGVLLGLLLALWLDRHVLAQLRGVSRSLRDRDPYALKGLPSNSGWGELSDLTSEVSLRIAREKQLERIAAEANVLREGLDEARQRIERWSRTEAWEPFGPRTGPVAALAESLDRAFERDLEARDQNLEAARQIKGALTDARGDARESVEQAERGFVESTALLTTVRELQRLSGELRIALEAAGVEPVAAGGSAREAAAAAIEELVAASAESVEHLSAGLARVREISDHVQLVANRATLVALQAASTGGAPEGSERFEELRRLTRDVRLASEGAESVARTVARAAAAANERMHAVRASVGSRLAGLPAEASGTARPNDDAARLLERVREMVQDATRKGERLSAAGERSSRAAERLARRLDDQCAEMEGLVVRLTRATPDTAAEGGAGEPLRLLETESTTEALLEGPDDARRGRSEERP